ncbi:hypothetical protein MATL_G00143270 [Megalops atlanticus]|uniref:N-acetyltransferase domain-containing protein n=1 Tax=Megalops atlanticus TaxID=7932 RepID=A0A9D3TB12_MEGAT|nr:hypothetical protein MATL_G00143270 [Megalops atlanticus]
MDNSVTHLHTVVFKPKKAGNRSDFTVQPIRVHFHKLLQTRDAPTLVPQVENRDVLSAVVSLFDVSLPDVGPRDIHDTIHCPDAQTIILLRRHADVLEEYRSRTPPCSRVAGQSPTPHPAESGEKEPGGRFSQVFSDSDESSSDESENSAEIAGQRSAWERFDSGTEEFLLKVRERRSQRSHSREGAEIPPTAVGAESLIVAAATYKLRKLTTGEKVLQLSLLATRRRYRNCGVGRYIVELLKSQSVCGLYEAFLTHADSDAVDFFTHCGLTDDALLNDKFKEVRDEWTNTTLMSYLPPFSTGPESQTPGFSLGLWELELEVEMARKKALLAYQQQAVCVTRLVHEVTTLREQLTQQSGQVKLLISELEKERERRHRVEQQFLEYKLRKTQQLLAMHSLDSDEQENSDSPKDRPSPDDTRADSVDTV